MALLYVSVIMHALALRPTPSSSLRWYRPHSESEMCRLPAETLHNLEMECRRQGWGTDPAPVYDEERDLFLFRNGKLALSREHGN